MRIWDIHPGYLSRASLLGEHRELHAIVSIILNNRKGYARHPETMRWRGCLGALGVRHGLLVEEMLLRGYRHLSPVPDGQGSSWPGVYIDQPGGQFAILEGRYGDGDQGRIPLPHSADRLWAQHKYSVLARDPGLYRDIGRQAARRKGGEFFHDLARTLAESLRTPPPQGRLMNALEHMWGYVSDLDPDRSGHPGTPAGFITEIRYRSLRHGVRYLLESTALSDLSYWVSRRK